MMNLQYVVVIKDSQIVGWAPTEIYSQITWYYITRRGSVIRCPMSYLIIGRRRKGKDLEVPSEYNYYCGLTKNPAFNFVILLFPRPLNKTRHLYETGCNSRQYSSLLIIQSHLSVAQASSSFLISTSKCIDPRVSHPPLYVTEVLLTYLQLF